MSDRDERERERDVWVVSHNKPCSMSDRDERERERERCMGWPHKFGLVACMGG